MLALERKLIGTAMAVLLAFAAPSNSYAATGVTIQAHDVVQDVVVTGPSRVAASPDNYLQRNRTVAFTAFGNRTVLDLQPNDRIVAGVLADLRHGNSAPNIYQGTIKSRPETWARIGIDDDGNLSGVVWDGAELLILDQASRLYGASINNATAGETLVVRGSDVRVTIADDLGSGPRTEDLDELFQASMVQSARSAVSRAISIGLVLDDEWVGLSSPSAIQRAIELTNIADGIFVSQAALHLNIGYIQAFNPDSPDPFTSSDPVTLLNQLADHKQAEPALSSMGLVHLFTRTNLDGDTRGIAKLSSFCAANRGVGLTEGAGSTIDALIMAHEIGHNFGARHDGVAGEGCGSTPQTFLMAPEVTGSSVFSQCSIDRMQQVLDSVYCLADVPDSDITVAPPILPAAVLYGEKLFFEYVVTNVGLESALDSNLIVSTEDVVELQGNGSPDRPCGYAGPQPSHRCDLFSLHSGESVTIGYAMLAKQVGEIHIDGIASASNDISPGNNAVRTTVEVIAATDLISSGDEVLHGSSHIKAGQSVDFIAEVTNHGDFESTAVATISTTFNHSLTTTDACSAINHFTLQCDLGNIQPGSSSSIEFSAQSDNSLIIDPAENRAGEIFVRVEGSLADFHPENDNALLSFVMWGTLKDLYSQFTEPPVSIELGESRSVSGRFGNSGPDAADNVSTQITSSPAGIQIDDVAVEKGTCLRVSTDRFDCEIGALKPGETVGITATYTGQTVGDYRFQIDAHENFNGHEANQEDNFEFVEISVQSPDSAPAEPPVTPQEPKQSGGGAFTWGLFCMLLLAGRRLYDRVIFNRDQVEQYVGSGC